MTGYAPGVERGEQAAPRRELLAGDGTGTGHEPLGHGCDGCSVERRAERDHAPRLAGAVVAPRPQERDNAAGRVADHVDGWRAAAQRAVHRSVEQASVDVQVAGAVTRQ